jgi:hypothetical protein
LQCFKTHAKLQQEPASLTSSPLGDPEPGCELVRPVQSAGSTSLTGAKQSSLTGSNSPFEKKLLKFLHFMYF